MKIAGAAARVQCLFDSTPEYCRPYLTEESPVYSITVTPEDLVSEQKLLDIEADEEGLRRRVFTDPFLERTVIQRKTAAFLLKQKILLLHGSTVAVDGMAYLFTARCGTGKSTHTRLWREIFGSRAVMVNDDRTFLRIGPSGILACGSPWSGKHGLDTNVCLPLAGICILERGPENRIRPLAPEEALPELLHQAYAPEDGCEQTLHALTAALAARVPLWHMACTKDPEAARTAYNAMSAVFSPA